ncbi:MAG: bifunctional nuclease family protein [Acidimicrobiales bacterium]|jgi:bifunctional DNase/RNase|nr:bifunctional nuclease family protein [Actinomycetota bacterium]
MVEVRLGAVRVDLQSQTPVLLLTETSGLGRTLPIFVGPPEATAIAFAVQGVVTPRPMTHDLMQNLVDALGAELERVVITELRDKTYFAELHFLQRGKHVSVSARPSDAVALAVRTGSPLFVSDDLMDAEGLMLPEDDDEDEEDATPEELVGEFREFLEQVRPEDFGA